MYELGNVFWKHPQITAEKARIFIKRFLDLKVTLIDIFSDNNLLKRSCNISKNEDITFYDASYIALAHKLKTSIASEDHDILTVAPRYNIRVIRLNELINMLEQT